ncbi:MAG: ribosome maturation factor RimM [Candidatus Azobacteroides sp.]|nr:ribosome maturation factor RimM [Candidatus Azobacteroides sp.]
MILRGDLIKIGRFGRPHGIKGEISFYFTNDSFDNEACPFLICELDGIFVPFKIEKSRFISDSTALILLKGKSSDAQVRLLAQKEVYFPKQYIEENPAEDGHSWEYFTGFTLIDERKGEIGSIAEVDTSTLNALFVIKKDHDELLIPATDDIIAHIDEKQKKIYVELPEGLLEY